MTTCYAIVDRETGEPFTNGFTPKLYSTVGSAKGAITSNDLPKFQWAVVEVEFELSIVDVIPDQQLSRVKFDGMVAEMEKTLDTIRASGRYGDEDDFRYWYGKLVNSVERFSGLWDKLKYV